LVTDISATGTGFDMRLTTTALAAAAAIAALCGGASAQENHGDWQAFSDNGRCWAASAPTSSTDGSTRAYASVMNQPSEGVRGSVAVISGDPATASGDVELKVDGKSFDMLPFDDAAFARSGAPEASLITAMRRGREMTVKWVADDGKSVEQVYSLKGFSSAKAAADSGCK
jgi:invasion protein IalB